VLMANMLFRRPGHGVGDQVVMIGIMLVGEEVPVGKDAGQLQAGVIIVRIQMDHEVEGAVEQFAQVPGISGGPIPAETRIGNLASVPGRVVRNHPVHIRIAPQDVRGPRGHHRGNPSLGKTLF